MKASIFASLVFFASSSAIAGSYPTKADAESVIRSYFTTYTAAPDGETTVADYGFSEKWLKQHKISPNHNKFNGFRINEFEFIEYKPPFYTTAILRRNTATHKIGGLGDNERAIHVLGVFKVITEDGRALIEPTKIEKDSRGTTYVAPYKVIYPSEDPRAIQKALSIIQARERANAPRVSSAPADSRRAATQLCEAQKATCFASCPPYRSVSATSANSLTVNGEHFECKIRCEAISCY